MDDGLCSSYAVRRYSKTRSIFALTCTCTTVTLHSGTAASTASYSYSKLAPGDNSSDRASHAHPDQTTASVAVLAFCACMTWAWCPRIFIQSSHTSNAALHLQSRSCCSVPAMHSAGKCYWQRWRIYIWEIVCHGESFFLWNRRGLNPYWSFIKNKGKSTKRYNPSGKYILQCSKVNKKHL